jgi:hypothetical protein
MPDDIKKIVLDQPAGKRLAHDHGGELVLYGDAGKAPLAHQVGGRVFHGSEADHPLVHMVCWKQEQPCEVNVRAKVSLEGSKEAPVEVRMTHHFADEHNQTLTVRPVEHTLAVDSKLHDPIHHALQMRTPLQVRFCNPWHVASDYRVELTMAGAPILSVRLTGATIATPQPCDEEPCPPVVKMTDHP